MKQSLGAGWWAGGRALAAGVWLCLALPASAASAAKTPVDEGVSGRVLDNLTAGTLQFQLVIEPCQERKCPLVLRALNRGHLLDAMPLLMPAATQNAVLQHADGDGWEMLRLFDPKQHFWRVGEEDRLLDVTASLVKFDAHQRGVLVTQKFGFDTVRRAHALYMLVDQKIQLAWSHRESDEPGWSLAHVVAMAGGTQIVCFWQWRAEDWDEADPQALPDEVKSTFLSWSTGEQKLAMTPAPAANTPLYAVVAGFYADTADARKALRVQGNTVCLSDLKPVVLSAARFPELKSEGAFLGNLLASQAGAERYRAELGRCIGASDLKIIPLTREKATESAEEAPGKALVESL